MAAGESNATSDCETAGKETIDRDRIAQIGEGTLSETDAYFNQIIAQGV